MTKFRLPRIEEPTQPLTINLTKSEEHLLNWIAEQLDLTPTEVLESFIGDLCSSWRTGGSDER